MDGKRNIKISPSGLSGSNEVQSFPLEGCLHFSIENTGEADVSIGFKNNYQPLPIKVNQHREFPWIDPDCMSYQGKLYVKFAALSTVIITAIYDTD